MSNSAKKATAVLEWFSTPCPAVPAVDTDALIGAGVSAEHAEDIAQDVEEVNRGIAEMNAGVQTLVSADGDSSTSLDEAWGIAERNMPILEGLLIYGGVTTHDLADKYGDSDEGEAYEAISVVWRDISDRDDYARELAKVIQDAK